MLDKKPKRIISLVPSQTELLFNFGLEEEVVGVTKFCVHPKGWLSQKKIIGGTKNPNIQLIQSLNPDLVIANKEENRKEDIEIISQFCPVWVSDVHNLNTACDMILSLGEIVGKSDIANQLINDIRNSFGTLNLFSSHIRCAYLIWWNPIMLAGPNTFINYMLTTIGMTNVCDSNESRYPELSLGQIKEFDPEVILLSSEPFPFSEKHIRELRKEFSNTKIILVDGELFSWYGPRLLLFKEYAQKLKIQLF